MRVGLASPFSRSRRPTAGSLPINVTGVLTQSHFSILASRRMSMSKIIVIIEGKQSDPLEEEEVRQRLRKGELSGSAMAWRPGLAGWQPLAKVLGEQGASEGGATVQASPSLPSRFAYKVVEQKQKSFVRGRMRASDLEGLLNTWAEQGWTLDRIISGETFSFLTGDKDVFMVIFRRPLS